MKITEETYKISSIILFTMFLLTGIKYLNIRRAYHTAEEQKVKFCKENVDFRCKIDTLEKENYYLHMDNSRYLDALQKLELKIKEQR